MNPSLVFNKAGGPINPTSATTSFTPSVSNHGEDLVDNPNAIFGNGYAQAITSLVGWQPNLRATAPEAINPLGMAINQPETGSNAFYDVSGSPSILNVDGHGLGGACTNNTISNGPPQQATCG
jgi:hypothetical protein